jgi:hypothetical protein
MVEIKFVIELVVIIAALALVVYIFWTNYSGIADQFFSWLKSLPAMVKLGS